MKSPDGASLLHRLPSVSNALKLLAAVVILLVSAAAWYEIDATREATISDTERQMARLDMVFAEQTGRAVEAVDLLVGSALETIQLHMIQNRPLTGIDDLFRRRIAGVRQLHALTVFDAIGQILVDTDKNQDLTPQAIVIDTLNRYKTDPQAGLLISPPYQGPDQRWYALLTRPMRATDGQVTGMGAGIIALGYFEDFYRAVELSENGAISLHLRDGTLLARFPHDDSMIGASWGELPPFKLVLANNIAGTLVMDSPVDGDRRVVAVRALKTFPLAVMVSVEQGRILINWRQGAYALIAIALSLCAAVAILLLMLAGRSRQIEHLLDEARDARTAAEQASNRMMAQISERERAEGALRQAQRMEAIGQLTGGVAHDFNNLLTVVIGNADILQRRMIDAEPAVTERLDSIRSAAERGATLTSHLLAFARRQPLMPKPVDLNATIQGMQKLLDSAVGVRATINLDLASDLWPAMVDQSQIELLILNLVINARDANTTPGIITIATANTVRACTRAPDTLPPGTLPPDTRADSPPPGDYVRITVSDTGVGMAPETLARVFEPFFTTKAPGAGSGLGLSQVFGTTRQSGGEVKIESELGQGTKVSVDLPRALAIPIDMGNPAGTARLQGSRGSILLVDDDPAVRGITATMLEDLGYTVQLADGAATALQTLEEDADIDVLMTDLVMPDINGSQLANMARDLRPTLPVIIVSGYADPLDSAWTLKHPLIRKPFTVADLHKIVEAALAERRETAG